MHHCARHTVRTAFTSWDADGSGTISREELGAVLTKLGNFKPEDVEQLLTSADSNGDGEIDFREFIDWLMVPAAPLGAAALMSECSVCLRADAPDGATEQPGTCDGKKAWVFGPAGKPVAFSDSVRLEREHTIALWMRLSGETAGDAWAPFVGDKLWGLALGLSPCGAFGVLDPRQSDPGRNVGASAPRDIWMLVFCRGSCDGANPGPNGHTEFFTASDIEGVRPSGNGRVEAVGGNRVLSEFGCGDSRVAAIASIKVWQRKLLDEELHQLFLWDAVKYGCLLEEQADWLKKGKRWIPERSEEEEAELQSRIADAASGRVKGALDLSGLKLADRDVPAAIAAVKSSFEDVTALILRDNYLTEDCVEAYIAPFLKEQVGPFRLDLKDNLDIGASAEPILLTAAQFAEGCSVDLRGTQAHGPGVTTLLNNSSEANNVRRKAAQDAKECADACAEFDKTQDELKRKWEKEVDDPIDSAGEEELLKDNGDGAAGKEAPQLPKFPEGKADKLKEVRETLALAARQLYDHRGGSNFPWAAPARPQNCGSGQVLAHFSYLGYSLQLKQAEDFALRLRQKGEESTAVPEDGRMDLHTAVERGAISIAAASGRSYGRGALMLRLHNKTESRLVVEIPAGVIFEHPGWAQKQNLCVGRVTEIVLPAGEELETKLGAYCLNMSCSCSAGDKMYLTSFLLDDSAVLRSQKKVWDFFEATFERHREEAGFKKKKGKKKGKK